MDDLLVRFRFASWLEILFMLLVAGLLLGLAVDLIWTIIKLLRIRKSGE